MIFGLLAPKDKLQLVFNFCIVKESQEFILVIRTIKNQN
jgi:hypothetical protein